MVGRKVFRSYDCSRLSLVVLVELHVALVKVPSKISGIAHHLGFQEFEDARLDAWVVKTCAFQSASHMQHPSLRSGRIHNIGSVVRMMKVQTVVSSVVDAASTHGIDPVGCLRRNVMLLGSQSGKGVTERGVVLVLVDTVVKVGHDSNNRLLAEDGVELPKVQGCIGIVARHERVLVGQVADHIFDLGVGFRVVTLHFSRGIAFTWRERARALLVGHGVVGCREIVAREQQSVEEDATRIMHPRILCQGDCADQNTVRRASRKNIW
jgi:hypothetical protein